MLRFIIIIKSSSKKEVFYKMLLVVQINPPSLFNSIHELIRMAFPDWVIKTKTEDAAQGNISIVLKEINNELQISGQINIKNKSLNHSNTYSLSAADKTNEVKRLIRVFIFELLSNFLEKPINAYGILSGVRPLKIVHRLFDAGLNDRQILNILTKEYLVAENKAAFLLQMAKNNREFLLSKEMARKLISVYIGIPYCPSRCYYCSFPGAVLRDYQKEMLPFLKVLHEEVKIVGEYLQTEGYQVQSIYIGGGTPGLLQEKHLDDLLATLNEQYINKNYCREITVEAGRPDTLNIEKLKIMRQAGVTRICINPQTMNDCTLNQIGRRHTTAQVCEAVELARRANIPIINMDLIIGLENETLKENLESIHRVIDLNPENITLHTLAVKRGSRLAETEGKSRVGDNYGDITLSMETARQILTKQGYIPYYMYRQKYMRANLENTGYSLPGRQCLYNINMMEERQTIIGLGGGSGSKFVDPSDWSLTNLHNPKDPHTYMLNMPAYVRAKVDKLNSLN